MCGVVGAVSQSSVNYLLFNVLKGLQHRGQQTAGLAILNGSYMHIKKDLGLSTELMIIVTDKLDEQTNLAFMKTVKK